MQKLGNLEKWQLVKAGQPIVFPAARKVRLEVRTPLGTNWYVDDDGRAYLTTTSSAEVLEFVPDGSVSLSASEDVRIYTTENERIHIDESVNPTFTKIANRKERNHEMELVAAKAAENATRRMERMYAEEMRIRDQRIAALEAAGEEVDHETGEIIDAGANSADGSADAPKKKRADRQSASGTSGEELERVEDVPSGASDAGGSED